MSKCKCCGQEIIWIMSPAGKAIPCDPIPVHYWQQTKAKGKIVTRNGDLISCYLYGDQETVTGEGYVPHWATCPKAGEFRRKK